MAIGTPWGPVVISTAFAVISGTGSVLILGSKTLREKLGIDVMAYLKGKAQGGDRSSADMPDDVGSRGGISLRRVAVTMKGIRAAGKVSAAMEPRDEFVEDAVARGPAMFMEVGDKVIARREALMAAVDAALEAGLPFDSKTRLCDLLLGPLFDDFRRSLSGDPPARDEPFQVKVKVDADLQGYIHWRGLHGWTSSLHNLPTPEGCTRTRKRYVQILPRRSRRAVATARLATSQLSINRLSRWLHRQCFWRNRRWRLLERHCS